MEQYLKNENEQTKPPQIFGNNTLLSIILTKEKSKEIKIYFEINKNKNITSELVGCCSFKQYLKAN